MMKKESYFPKNILVYILLQLAVTIAFFYDEHQGLDLFLYGLSDYLFIVFAYTTVSGNIKSVSFLVSILDKNSLKMCVNLFVLCFFVICAFYILLAAPVLLATYSKRFPDFIFFIEQSIFLEIIVVPLLLIIISYIVYFYLAYDNNGFSALKRSFTALVKRKVCTLGILCLFITSQVATIIIEDSLVQFSNSNNFEIYPLTLAIVLINHLHKSIVDPSFKTVV